MVSEIDCGRVQQKRRTESDMLLLDCREQPEWNLVRIEGATWIPMSEITRRVEELNDWKNRDVVVYCHHGVRSLQVAAWLEQQGFSRVRSMTGGIDAWARDIDPALPRY